MLLLLMRMEEHGINVFDRVYYILEYCLPNNISELYLEHLFPL